MAKQKPSSVHRHLNNIGWENVRIVLIKNVAAQTKDQLLMVEQYCIDRLKPELNKISAYTNCPHGREHCKCIDCGGVGICEHNIRKSQCKDCNGDTHKCGVCDYTAGSASNLKRHRRTTTHLTKLYETLQAKLNSYSLTY